MVGGNYLVALGLRNEFDSNTNRLYGWEWEDPAFYLCCVLLFRIIRVHLKISQLNFHDTPLCFPCRAVIARGMATEKQSESMYFHVMNVHSFFLVLKLIVPIHFPRITTSHHHSLEPNSIYQKYPENYLLNENGFRGQAQG